MIPGKIIAAIPMTLPRELMAGGHSSATNTGNNVGNPKKVTFENRRNNVSPLHIHPISTGSHPSCKNDPSRFYRNKLRGYQAPKKGEVVIGTQGYKFHARTLHPNGPLEVQKQARYRANLPTKLSSERWTVPLRKLRT